VVQAGAGVPGGEEDIHHPTPADLHLGPEAVVLPQLVFPAEQVPVVKDVVTDLMLRESLAQVVGTQLLYRKGWLPYPNRKSPGGRDCLPRMRNREQENDEILALMMGPSLGLGPR